MFFTNSPTVVSADFQLFYLCFPLIQRNKRRISLMQRVADLYPSRCVIGVQKARLCYTTLCMILSPRYDPTVWLSFSLQPCSLWTVSRIMSSTAKEGSTHSLKYVTTGGVWLSLYYVSHQPLVSPQVCFLRFQKKQKGVYCNWQPLHHCSLWNVIRHLWEEYFCTTIPRSPVYGVFLMAVENKKKKKKENALHMEFFFFGPDKIPCIIFRFHLDSQYSSKYFSSWL